MRWKQFISTDMCVVHRLRIVENHFSVMFQQWANIPCVNGMGFQRVPNTGRQKNLSDFDPMGAMGAQFQSNLLLLSASYADFVGSSLKVWRMLRMLSIYGRSLHQSWVRHSGLIVAKLAIVWYYIDLAACLVTLTVWLCTLACWGLVCFDFRNLLTVREHSLLRT